MISWAKQNPSSPQQATFFQGEIAKADCSWGSKSALKNHPQMIIRVSGYGNTRRNHPARGGCPNQKLTQRRASILPVFTLVSNKKYWGIP